MSGSLTPTRVSANGRLEGPDRSRAFLASRCPTTPCLVMDLDAVTERYTAISEAFDGMRIFYAVKANPTIQVMRTLVDLGASFEVASPGEIGVCLSAGAAPGDIAYTNTIKKRADIALAHRLGVRLYTFDCEGDLQQIAEEAPGADVVCRLLVEPPGSRTPFGRKFGCTGETAIELLEQAANVGLTPYGISFHVGSQQLDPNAWEVGVEAAASVSNALARRGIRIQMIDLGGGFPATYTETIPPLHGYARAIEESLDRHFPAHDRPRIAIEPGRAIVADAGIIRSEVVMVSRRSRVDVNRWVYLDIGRYGGLAETEGEAITYRLATSRDGGPTGPVILAGPSADGDDVLYQHTKYRLPLDLQAGDHVDILSAGAYTASYASVSFNGFSPLRTFCVGGTRGGTE